MGAIRGRRGASLQCSWGPGRGAVPRGARQPAPVRRVRRLGWSGHRTWATRCSTPAATLAPHVGCCASSARRAPTTPGGVGERMSRNTSAQSLGLTRCSRPRSPSVSRSAILWLLATRRAAGPATRTVACRTSSSSSRLPTIISALSTTVASSPGVHRVAFLPWSGSRASRLPRPGASASGTRRSTGMYTVSVSIFAGASHVPGSMPPLPAFTLRVKPASVMASAMRGSGPSLAGSMLRSASAVNGATLTSRSASPACR